MENLKLTIQEIADLKEGRRTLEEIFKSYHGKPHLENLPHDLRTNDPNKLKERLKANNKLLREAKSEYKDAQEMDEMMENNIKEIEDNEKILKGEIKEMEEQNAQISETMSKVYDHFEDVTMLTEDAGWRIKKEFDKVINSEFWDSGGDEERGIEERMKQFIDETTLKGYIGPAEVKEIKQLNKDLNDIMGWNYGEDSRPVFSSREWDKFHEDSQFVQSLIDKYCNDYDISKDTPLTRQLAKIEEEGNLSDKWDMIQQRNKNEIKRRNELIEKENERKEGIKENQKENKREMGKIRTRINDHEAHELKILEKLEKLGEV